MRVHVRTRNRMHQSAIVLVRCVPVSFSFRRHIGEDPGDEVGKPQHIRDKCPAKRTGEKLYIITPTLSPSIFLPHV